MGVEPAPAADAVRATLADAWVAMARSTTRRRHAPRARSSRLPARTEVVVHVDVSALSGGDGAAWVHDGPAISPEIARRLCCDGATRTLIHNRRGTPLDLGRRQRSVNPALRLALELRDGGCVFPGCGRRYRPVRPGAGGRGGAGHAG
ncbi:MAG TPA: DUF222 domain-containing protein [Acidimicrobiales bacterium]|nr:DUF222 domain-containing protein [Acidimicrobiales bacterium]